jgi:hypothetical protein
MAIVYGPLHSDAASGQFADALVFGKWKGRAVVRRKVSPTNPKSAKQTGVRSMMGFLAAMWKAKTDPKWTGWTSAAEAGQISTFNAFIAENLRRWQLFKGPTQVYPAAEASSVLTITTMTCTGNVGYATVAITPSGGTALWGFLVFRDTAEITTPSWANCVGVIEANGTNAVTFTDSPLDAETYHYRVAAINTDGVIGTVKADATAVVT